MTKQNHTHTYIYILVNSKLKFWCQQLWFVDLYICMFIQWWIQKWQFTSSVDRYWTLVKLIFTPILVFAMVILWYLAEASEDEPPRPVGLGNNMKNYNYMQVKTVSPTQNRYQFNDLSFIKQSYLKKTKFDGITLTLMVILSELPFLWPIATAMSIALNPESDSMVGSAPLSIQ